MNTTLIASTVCSIPQLIQACPGVNKPLDIKQQKINTLDGYAMALEVLSRNEKAIGDLQYAYSSLDLINLTFVIKLEDYDLVNVLINLATMKKIVIGQRQLLLCGTLREFKELLVAGSGEGEEIEIRRTCNEIYTFLDMLGFKAIFSKKRHLMDQTFVLMA